MQNTLNDGFVQLYTQNEKYIPSFSFKEGKSELKNAVESTVDQFTEVDPIEPQSIPSGIVTDGSGEPTVKEDVASVGETIISDDDDVLIRPMGDEESPAGTDVSVKTVEVADAAGLSGFINPTMDDFLGEQEGTGDEEKGDKDITPEEVLNREMCDHLISDPFNTLNTTVFDNASDILSQKIGYTYESFKHEIVPEVKELTTKIIDETNKMMNANGSTQLAESLEIEAPSVEMINWNQMNALGSKDEIIANAKSFGKLKMTDVMNFNASRSTTRMWLPRLEKVDIPESIGNSIVRKMATEIGENVEEAGIITASNPDTPEGQVASGTEYLKKIFNKKSDIKNGSEHAKLDTEGGFDVTTDDTDKQTEAHSPEEALEVSKESFTLLMTDRKVSGGVRLGNKNIFNKYFDMLKDITDSNRFNYLNSVYFPVLKKVKKENLPEDNTKLINRDFALSVMDFFNKNTLNVKNLIVKLKATSNEDPSDADINDISVTTEKMHKDLNTLLNTDIAKTVNIYPALNKQLINVSVKSSKWMIDDVRNIVKNYSKSIENYRAFYDNIKSLYEMSALKNKDKNKVFNYGYYLVESMCGLFSTLYSSIMSTCMSVVNAYETGVKNSYDQTDIDKLMLSPTMDDFLGEDEGTEKDNKDGDDHLKSADEALYSIRNDFDELDVIATEDMSNVKEKLLKFWEAVKRVAKHLYDIVMNFINNFVERFTSKAEQLKKAKSEFSSLINQVVYPDEIGDEEVYTDSDIVLMITKIENCIPKDAGIFDDNMMEIYSKRINDEMLNIFTDDNYVKKPRKEAYQRKNQVMNIVARGIRLGAAEDVLKDVLKSIRKVLMEIMNFNVGDKNVSVTVTGDLKVMPREFRQKLDTLRDAIKGGVVNTAKMMDYILNIFNQYKKAALANNERTANASTARTNTNNSGLKALPAGASESKSVSREVYNILSKHSSYYAFARKMNNAMRAMDTGHQVPEMLRVANKYPKVLQKFATMDFGISLKDGESLKKNANSVREMLNCIGLHLLVCKQYFNTNNVLLLDATHANPDTMEEFKKQDGSMEDINLHLLHRYILPNQPVPNMGIRISEIIRNKQNVAMEHMKRTESIKDKVRINHDGASILAYTRVLNDYLKEIPEEYIPKGMTRNNFIAMKYSLVKATSQYLNNKDHTVDECIYRFLLKLKYADKPMYQDMYNKMEIQYRRLAESADDTITMSDKATADAKVVSDIVMNFLFDYFVEK